MNVVDTGRTVTVYPIYNDHISNAALLLTHKYYQQDGYGIVFSSDNTVIMVYSIQDGEVVWNNHIETHRAEYIRNNCKSYDELRSMV